jgi:anti-sigma factor RsiW
MTMMRDCPDGALRDLLPDFVHETLAPVERVRVAAHVATCADCAAEVELIRSARAAFPAPVVDMTRIVNAIAPAKRRTAAGLGSRQWLMAAGVSFLVLGGVTLATLRGSFGGASGRPAVVDSSLSASQSLGTNRAMPLASVRLAQGESAAKPGARAAELSFGGGLSDLSDEQLKTLLREIGALDASLSTEPEAHPIPIVPLRGGDDNAW